MFTNLNNFDIIILFIVGISALIAYSRGLIKEVLSIIGWILVTIIVIQLLPLVNPFVEKYIISGTFTAVASALFIGVTFLVIWVLFTGKIVDKIRSSKLSGLDRNLGLFFGIARACLLLILAYILTSWMIPVEKQSDSLTESKYFNIAGKFAKPIEEMIPADTLENIKAMATGFEDEEESDEEGVEKSEKEAKKKSENDALFEKLTQPKVEGKSKSKEKETKKSSTEDTKKEEKQKKSSKSKKDDGYAEKEREELDKLIDKVD